MAVPNQRAAFLPTVAREGMFLSYHGPSTGELSSCLVSCGYWASIILALERNWLQFQQEFSVLPVSWKAPDLIKYLLLFSQLYSLSIPMSFTDDPTYIWKEWYIPQLWSIVSIKSDLLVALCRSSLLIYLILDFLFPEASSSHYDRFLSVSWSCHYLLSFSSGFIIRYLLLHFAV